jgi:hypothetical protein
MSLLASENPGRRISVKAGQRVHAVGIVFACLSASLLSGCTTAWQQKSTFTKTTQTALRVESSPSGHVFVNDRSVGKSPLTTTLNYEGEYARKNRRVSFWITQPQHALWICVWSSGAYLPFSILPVDIQTKIEPTANFKGKEYRVRIRADGYRDWEERIRLTGQENYVMRPTLTRAGAN